MQDTVTVLTAYAERGKQGLPMPRVSHERSNPVLYRTAYGQIYRKAGALTRGVTTGTVDALSLEQIQGIIALLRQERYHWTPVRRVSIPKATAKERPLGVPTWSDQLLMAVLRRLLAAAYEPQFAPASPGFRPGRGCHTALEERQTGWKGTQWVVEGDITGCFDNIDHDVLRGMLGAAFQDGRFLTLMRHLRKAGYWEDWRYHNTYSGTPQGGLVSPIRSNSDLDRLDKLVRQTLRPAYNRGKRRAKNTE